MVCPCDILASSIKRTVEPLRKDSSYIKTKIMDYTDFAICQTDKYGAKYSIDGTRLLSVPDYLEYYTIEEGTKIICDDAFCGSRISAIVIPDSVVTIGAGAFLQSNISSIIMPDTIENIGERAFFECFGLHTVTIPKGVSVIHNETFSGCNLEVVNFHEHVLRIEKSAFSSCDKLQNLILPDYLTEIQDEAFRNCISLKSIEIPSRLNSISSSCFYDCHNITSICVNKNNPFYDSRDNCNAIIETESNTLVIGCSTSKISKSIRIIGDNAFANCINLNSIVIPEGVREINDYAFYGCKNLNSINFPNSLCRIGSKAFTCCSKLAQLFIPKSLTGIGIDAFSNCGNLLSINVSKDNSYYDSRENCNAKCG